MPDFVHPERERVMQLRQSRGAPGPSPYIAPDEGWGARFHGQPYSTEPTPEPDLTPQVVERRIVRRYIEPGLWPVKDWDFGAGARGRPPMPMPEPPIPKEIPQLSPAPAAGFSREIEFFPKRAVSAYIASGSNQRIYTEPHPTAEFTQAVAQLSVEAEIPPNSRVVVTPQVSNDNRIWKALTAFTEVNNGGTYPKTQVIKITTICKFLRFEISLRLTTGTGTVGATMGISAVCRTGAQE